MVYLVLGTNSYASDRAIADIVVKAGVELEIIDGVDVTLERLPDLLMGTTIFNDKRLILIKGLSQNKSVWNVLPDWLERVDGDTVEVILSELSVDKRTKTYKALSLKAKVIEADMLEDRDWRRAEAWLEEYAKSIGVKLSHNQVRSMVQRATVPSDKPGRQVIDQQMLAAAVESLKSLERIDDETLDVVLPQSSEGTVFDILSFAIGGETERVDKLINQLRTNEDPHLVFASLASQWSQLAAVSLVGAGQASNIGIHPFVAQKLSELSRDVTRGQLIDITRLAARLDANIKQSGVTPWNAVERLVLAIELRENQTRPA